MATETASVPVNGNYAPHQAQAYGNAEASQPAPSAAPATSSSAVGTATSGNGAADIPKAEVGWYFVEQYYTTLSRHPEKLHLFYNKRSQFVSGVEAEKVSVCVGQKAINDRIKELDIQDCKVRVTNVDSQGSDTNIVIQVIGEISNKSAPHRKFVQTFVLAGQTNGYFVLNDIFRYITEEEELEEDEAQQESVNQPSGFQEPAPTVAEEAKPETLTSSGDAAAIEHDASEVDKELKEAIQSDPAVDEVPPPANEVNGTPVPEAADVAEAEEAPAAAVGGAKDEPNVQDEETTETVAPEEAAGSEKANEQEPVQATSQPTASTTAPAAAPTKPAAPKTWANLAAAANRVATPTVPVTAASSASGPAPAQPKAAPPAPIDAQSNAQAHPPTPSAAVPAPEPSPVMSPQDSSSGWQTAGHDYGKRQPRPQPQPAAGETQNSRAYIKNVYESVDAEALRSTLAKYGELAYFDVSRPKNCAFVDFATPAGYQAAVAANPHQIGNDTIWVEERRIRPNSYMYSSRGLGRGRGGADGRQGGQGRGGFNKDGGRGGFNPRGRGNNMAPRGRGAPQPA